MKYFFVLFLSVLLTQLPAHAEDQPTGGAPVPGPVQPAAPSKQGKALEDYTDKLKLVPGVSITFPIVDGIDTHRQKIGNYDFTASIHDNNAEGYGYKWTMSKPAEAKGFRAVAPEDEKDSNMVSLFYQDGQSLTMSGYTNAVRVSDALYKGLKAGKTLPFQIDLEDNKDVPSTIKMVGREYAGVIVDGKKVRVRAIKAETDNKWHYWIMDKASFPIMVQGDGPFKWRDPRFDSTDAEAQRVIKDLEKNGVATTYAILFAFNSAKLENSSKRILSGIATYLKNNADIKLAVEGHCDIVGTAQYNMVLSQKRANSVRDYLVARGIASSRLSPKGYGFSQPIADNMTAAGRAKNRRVVFRKI
jgi:outer membrane protein OmpA-like peptidoglycan-associated protein